MSRDRLHTEDGPFTGSSDSAQNRRNTGSHRTPSNSNSDIPNHFTLNPFQSSSHDQTHAEAQSGLAPSMDSANQSGQDIQQPIRPAVFRSPRKFIPRNVRLDGHSLQLNSDRTFSIIPSQQPRATEQRNGSTSFVQADPPSSTSHLQTDVPIPNQTEPATSPGVPPASAGTHPGLRSVLKKPRAQKLSPSFDIPAPVPFTPTRRGKQVSRFHPSVSMTKHRKQSILLTKQMSLERGSDPNHGLAYSHDPIEFVISPSPSPDLHHHADAHQGHESQIHPNATYSQQLPPASPPTDRQSSHDLGFLSNRIATSIKKKRTLSRYDPDDSHPHPEVTPIAFPNDIPPTSELQVIHKDHQPAGQELHYSSMTTENPKPPLSQPQSSPAPEQRRPLHQRHQLLRYNPTSPHPSSNVDRNNHVSNQLRENNPSAPPRDHSTSGYRPPLTLDEAAASYQQSQTTFQESEAIERSQRAVRHILETADSALKEIPPPNAVIMHTIAAYQAYFESLVIRHQQELYQKHLEQQHDQSDAAMSLLADLFPDKLIPTDLQYRQLLPITQQDMTRFEQQFVAPALTPCHRPFLLSILPIFSPHYASVFGPTAFTTYEFWRILLSCAYVSSILMLLPPTLRQLRAATTLAQVEAIRTSFSRQIGNHSIFSACYNIFQALVQSSTALHCIHTLSQILDGSSANGKISPGTHEVLRRYQAQQQEQQKQIVSNLVMALESIRNTLSGIIQQQDFVGQVFVPPESIDSYFHEMKKLLGHQHEGDALNILSESLPFLWSLSNLPLSTIDECRRIIDNTQLSRPSSTSPTPFQKRLFGNSSNQPHQLGRRADGVTSTPGLITEPFLTTLNTYLGALDLQAVANQLITHATFPPNHQLPLPQLLSALQQHHEGTDGYAEGARAPLCHAILSTNSVYNGVTSLGTLISRTLSLQLIDAPAVFAMMYKQINLPPLTDDEEASPVLAFNLNELPAMGKIVKRMTPTPSPSLPPSPVVGTTFEQSHQPQQQPTTSHPTLNEHHSSPQHLRSSVSNHLQTLRSHFQTHLSGNPPPVRPGNQDSRQPDDGPSSTATAGSNSAPLPPTDVTLHNAPTAAPLEATENSQAAINQPSHETALQQRSSAPGDAQKDSALTSNTATHPQKPATQIQRPAPSRQEVNKQLQELNNQHMQRVNKLLASLGSGGSDNRGGHRGDNSSIDNNNEGSSNDSNSGGTAHSDRADLSTNANDNSGSHTNPPSRAYSPWAARQTRLVRPTMPPPPPPGPLLSTHQYTPSFLPATANTGSPFSNVPKTTQPQSPATSDDLFADITQSYSSLAPAEKVDIPHSRVGSSQNGKPHQPHHTPHEHPTPSLVPKQSQPQSHGARSASQHHQPRASRTSTGSSSSGGDLNSTLDLLQHQYKRRRSSTMEDDSSKKNTTRKNSLWSAYSSSSNLSSLSASTETLLNRSLPHSLASSTPSDEQQQQHLFPHTTRTSVDSYNNLHTHHDTRAQHSPPRGSRRRAYGSVSSNSSTLSYGSNATAYLTAPVIFQSKPATPSRLNPSAQHPQPRLVQSRHATQPPGSSSSRLELPTPGRSTRNSASMALNRTTTQLHHADKRRMRSSWDHTQQPPADDINFETKRQRHTPRDLHQKTGGSSMRMSSSSQQRSTTRRQSYEAPSRAGQIPRVTRNARQTTDRLDDKSHPPPHLAPYAGLPQSQTRAFAIYEGMSQSTSSTMAQSILKQSAIRRISNSGNAVGDGMSTHSQTMIGTTQPSNTTLNSGGHLAHNTTHNTTMNASILNLSSRRAKALQNPLSIVISPSKRVASRRASSGGGSSFHHDKVTNDSPSFPALHGRRRTQDPSGLSISPKRPADSARALLQRTHPPESIRSVPSSSSSLVSDTHQRASRKSSWFPDLGREPVSTLQSSGQLPPPRPSTPRAGKSNLRSKNSALSAEGLTGRTPKRTDTGPLSGFRQTRGMR